MPLDRIEEWSDRWRDKRIGFHMNRVNPDLEEWYTEWIGGAEKQTILVPLCGKTLDLKWLYDKGHTVLGIEGVKTAIEQFFAEHKVAFTVEKSPDGVATVYKSDDNRLRLYCGDLFDMNATTLGGKVDAVWDRASYVAIRREDRKRYGEFMRDVLKEQFRYLLSVMEYDPSRFSGPPRHLPLQDIQNDMGSFADIRLLHSKLRTRDDEAIRGRLISWNLEEITDVLYVLTPKQ